MANLTYTVQNKNGSYDGDMVVKQYTSMTINAGDTVTTDQPCRGLLIYVQGNCTINGTLSMKGRGALANPTVSGGSDNNAVDSNGLRLPFLTASGTDTLSAASTLFNGCGTAARTVIANQKSISSNGTIMQIVRIGGAGLGKQWTGNVSNNTGTNGNSIANGSGSGGTGGVGYGDLQGNVCCKGTAGTCFSGGSGGGGVQQFATSTYNGNASEYGGKGGDGVNGHTANITGGAGNPNGTPVHHSGGNAGSATIVSSGESGTGGIIWLIVGGNLTIGSTGLITVEGSKADSMSGSYSFTSMGGGSGGGVIKIAYRGTFINNGTIAYSGGLGGTHNAGLNYIGNGGNGGSGSYQALQVK